VYRDRHYLLPLAWTNQAKYLLYMLSWWPRVGALLFVAAAMFVLLRRRNEHSVELLRMGLITYLAAQLMTVVIDMFAFPAFRSEAILALGFPAIFLFYTFRSQRLARVCGRVDWLEPSRRYL
jgi:hypothetical protein